MAHMGPNKAFVNHCSTLFMFSMHKVSKGTLLGTPNREPLEYSRNIMDPGRYIPIIYLLYSLGSRFGVPRRVPLVSPRGG